MSKKYRSSIQLKTKNGMKWSIACGILSAFFLFLVIWPTITSYKLILLVGLLAVCALIVVLKLNAEALHQQTKEDIVYVHLVTSLNIGLAMLSPIIGVWLALKIAIMLLKGKFKQSGGTLKKQPPPHSIGKTSFHLGILLALLTIITQCGWLILINNVYSGLYE